MGLGLTRAFDRQDDLNTALYGGPLYGAIYSEVGVGVNSEAAAGVSGRESLSEERLALYDEFCHLPSPLIAEALGGMRGEDRRRPYKSLEGNIRQYKAI